jgi:hypothetical protein
MRQCFYGINIGIDENRSDRTEDVLHLQLVLILQEPEIGSARKEKMRRVPCGRCGVVSNAPKIAY